MRDAVIKRFKNHLTGAFERRGAAKVLSKPERNARQFQPAAAAAGIRKRLISIDGGCKHLQTSQCNKPRG
jgi:hypothetical protein